MPLFSQLKSLASQLEKIPGHFSNAEQNPSKDAEQLDDQQRRVCKELEENLQKLEQNANLLDEVKAAIGELVASQVAVQNSLSCELSTKQEDLSKELIELKVILTYIKIYLSIDTILLTSLT